MEKFQKFTSLQFVLCSFLTCALFMLLPMQADSQTMPISDTVELRIEATNVDGVTVLVNGKKSGVTPLQLKLPKSSTAVTVAFKKQGYFSKELRVTPHRARTIKIKLDKVPPPPKKKDPRENLPF